MKTCLGCGGRMQSIGGFPLQKGRAGAFLGVWNNVLEGALDVSAFCCENCRRLEFYLADEENTPLSKTVSRRRSVRSAMRCTTSTTRSARTAAGG